MSVAVRGVDVVVYRLPNSVIVQAVCGAVCGAGWSDVDWLSYPKAASSSNANLVPIQPHTGVLSLARSKRFNANSPATKPIHACDPECERQRELLG